MSAPAFLQNARGKSGHYLNGLKRLKKAAGPTMLRCKLAFRHLRPNS